MERNQIIGFALIFAIIMAWSILNKPVEIEKVPNEIIEKASPQSPEIHQQDSVIPSFSTTEDLGEGELSILRNQYSVFGPSAVGTESEEIIENDKIKIVLSNKGGRIKYIELKKFYKIKKDQKPEDPKTLVRLFEDVNNEFNYALNLQGKTVNTSDLFFNSDKSSNQVIYRLQGENGTSFNQTYKLTEGSYVIDYNIETVGLSGILTSAQLEIKNYLDKIERNSLFEKRNSTVYFKESDEDSDYCSCTSSDTEDKTGKKIEWFSFANQFFNTSFITKSENFNGLIASTEMLDDSESKMKIASADVSLPLSGANQKLNLDIYAGPNEYSLLKSFDNDLQDIIPFGRSIFGDINRHFIRPFFDWLSQFIGSKGLVIIVLIFIIKMVLYPLTYKMLHSQAKMGALKPQLAKMKDKYKDDAQKQQMETMKVYREYGVNPMGGCMPMVIQMPIWYALFRFFPGSITFRQEPFLWASDLSSYDAFMQLPFEIPGFGAHLSLFTVLWAVTTVIYTFYNMKHMDMTANPAMKYVQYLMPLMFFVFFNNYASGLTCYMFFSNLMNIAQTVITKKFVFDDDKILAELNIQKAKPKKKGGFQDRLAQAMKQQQLSQEQKKNQTKKK